MLRSRRRGFPPARSAERFAEPGRDHAGDDVGASSRRKATIMRIGLEG